MRMDVNGNNYYINRSIRFQPIGTLHADLIKTVFQFAYNMTFGKAGEHRNHRTGGTHRRRNAEIFANTFQGKLAEFALFYVLSDKGINVSDPDLGVFGLGEWDSSDLTIGELLLSLKSTKSFGNLLLLEENDWDANANYLPNGHGYDYTFLIRMNPYCEDILKRNRFLYSDTLNRDDLEQIVLTEQWSFDIPGFVTRQDLIQVINEEQIIPQGAMLNGRTRMDASNYYVQAGDLRGINEFINIFR